MLERRQECLQLLEEARASGCKKSVACKDLGVPLRTVERWEKSPSVGDRRRGPSSAPKNKLSAKEKEEVLKVCNSKENRDLSPCQIVPKLADEGVYLASESTFYRVLRQEALLAHRSHTRPSVNRRPKPLMATSPNEVWSWDITYLRSSVRGEFFYLYLVEDIFSRAIVGWEVHEKECSNSASELIKDTAQTEGIKPSQLTLHSDNGGPMKGATMLSTLQRLGVIPSFSRPSVSDDNPFSEALFKTVKYCPKYPQKPFESLEEARRWVREFVDWYNNQHLHSGIKFVTPMSRHLGSDKQLLIKRKEVYEKAKRKNPSRWSGSSRNWERPEKIFLNNLQRENEGANHLAS